MSSWSESLTEYRKHAPHMAPGPMERMWQVPAEETVFLSATEILRREQVAHARGVHETEARLHREYEMALTSARTEFLRALTSFQEQRSRYFSEMESEVVRLALAAGRTVIEREICGNPAILSEAVRDSLQRLEDGSVLRLRVPEQDLSDWKASLALELDRSSQFQIVSDTALVRGQCVVESVL